MRITPVPTASRISAVHSIPTPDFARRMQTSPLFREWVERTLAFSLKQDVVAAYVTSQGWNPKQLTSEQLDELDSNFNVSAYEKAAAQVGKNAAQARARVLQELTRSTPQRDPFTALFAGSAPVRKQAIAREEKSGAGILFENAHALVLADWLVFNPFGPKLVVVPKVVAGDPSKLTDVQWAGLEKVVATANAAMKTLLRGARVDAFVHAPSERSVSQLHVHVAGETFWDNMTNNLPKGWEPSVALKTEAASFYQRAKAFMAVVGEA